MRKIRICWINHGNFDSEKASSRDWPAEAYFSTGSLDPLRETKFGSSKKYKDKICVYCRESTSTTADHVFPREFFQKHQRSNLPKVPSCKSCSNEKSKLEHYLLSVLPFGATHSYVHQVLSVDVPKRLERNQNYTER